LLLVSLLALICGTAIVLVPLTQLALLAAAIIALTVAGIIFAEPAIGMGLTLFFAPFGPLENIMFQLPVESGQVLLALTLAAWLARMLYRRHLRARAGLLAWPLLAFVAVAVLSFFAARSFELWAKECVKWLEVLAVYVLVVSEVRARPHTLRFFVGAILISTLFEAALGIYQFGMRSTGPDEFAILGGRFYRSYGTFEQPNPFGGYMGLTWPFALGLALWAWRQVFRQRDKETREHGEANMMISASPHLPVFTAPQFLMLAIVATLTAALAFVALVLSWSRGAWLGASVAAVLVLIVAARRPVAALGILVVIAMLVISLNLTDLLPASLRSRLTDFASEFTSLDVRGVNVNDSNYAVIERLAHWQAAQNMILDRPYFGIGFGNYGAAYEQYRTLNWPIALGHAHNYYLNIFAETGVAGFIAYLVLWGMVFMRTLVAIARRDGRETSVPRPSPVPYLALGLLGAWIHLSVHHLFDSLYVANIFLLIGVYFGLLDALIDNTDSTHTSATVRVTGRNE
jgi:O-antigen ligase